MTNFNLFYKIFRPIIFLLDAEFCHNCAIFLLKHNLIPAKKQKTHYVANSTLHVNLFNRLIANPIGLAAGFDKNAECIKNLAKFGFGFIEVGTATPLPQSGNNKPRLFRLAKYKSIVNRFGFNNKGGEYFATNLKKYYLNKQRNKAILIGANIGKNKNSTDISQDYITMMQKVYNYCDYITINISSPNTPGLRDIQNENNLNTLLNAIKYEREALTKANNIKKPILVKISPDIDHQQVVYISNLIIQYDIDGVILTNTTIQKKFDNLNIAYEGGVSGRLLKQKSLEILKLFNNECKQRFVIISAGGIENANDVKLRLQNGANAVQIYSSLIYGGFGLVDDILKNIRLNNFQ